MKMSVEEGIDWGALSGNHGTSSLWRYYRSVTIDITKELEMMSEVPVREN